MKRQLILGFAALTITGLFPACTTVVEDEKPTVHSTTTTETTRVRPVQSSSVESTTVHSAY
jgi:hypothetical protein